MWASFVVGFLGLSDSKIVAVIVRWNGQEVGGLFTSRKVLLPKTDHMFGSRRRAV